MQNHKHYAYRVIWSEEDEEFVGLCAEFPSLSYLDESQVAALTGIVDLVGQVVADMANNNEKIPVPLIAKRYSGKLSLRIPPEQHCRLALKAAEEGVSLNHFISSKLLPT